MKTLSKDECMTINGGQPDENTSFAYDCSYYISAACKWVSNLFN